MDTPLTVDLYSELNLGYNSMLHLSDVDCGGYTNQFKYIDGPALDGSEPYGADMSQFTFSEEFEGEFTLQGQVTDKLWIGTHSFQIQSRNGVFDEGSERGENGLFESVDSEILTITVEDPCTEAVINSD